MLVERGAEVDARDKGGLIPLHNASSYGHADVAALLIRSGTSVNATDKWGFAPLHEAAQKGRTQLCALLVSIYCTLSNLSNMNVLNNCILLQLAHGADPFLKNQEGQTALELSTADDVRSLLQDAMLGAAPVPPSLPSIPPSSTLTVLPPTPQLETVQMPSGNTITLSLPVNKLFILVFLDSKTNYVFMYDRFPT